MSTAHHVCLLPLCREQGYGLMCVGYPLTDLVLEIVPEDEVYELQFGAAFASQVRSMGFWVACMLPCHLTADYGGL